jgi:hypothetical protein
VMEEIRALVGFEGRAPGSDAERRAAGHLEQRVRELGRDVDVEAVDTWPNWPLAYSIPIVAAIVGSLVSVAVPVVGVALVLVATLLLFLDAAGVFPLLRRSLGRRSSQNVVSREDSDKSGQILLVAHYDAGRTGAAFHRRLAERRAVLAKLLRRPIGPLHPVMAAMALLLLCCIGRMFVTGSLLLTVIQFVPTVALLLTLPLLLDVAVGQAAPGAGDNASGVAVALRLADRYGGSLEHFDLTLVLTGAQEALADGMRGFLRRHRSELDRSRSVFVNLDEVAAGTVRYARREGLLVALRSHVQLVELCDEIAEDDEEAGAFAARGIVSRAPSDGAAARAGGFPAITVSCRNALDYVPEHHQATDTVERVDTEALERAYGFCAQLIERIDASIGPDLALDREQTMLTEEKPAT